LRSAAAGKLAEHVGEEVVSCGLIIEQRTNHQITGEPMKFLTLADWTGNYPDNGLSYRTNHILKYAGIPATKAAVLQSLKNESERVLEL